MLGKLPYMDVTQIQLDGKKIGEEKAVVQSKNSIEALISQQCAQTLVHKLGRERGTGSVFRKERWSLNQMNETTDIIHFIMRIAFGIWITIKINITAITV